MAVVLLICVELVCARTLILVACNLHCSHPPLILHWAVNPTPFMKTWWDITPKSFQNIYCTLRTLLSTTTQQGDSVGHSCWWQGLPFILYKYHPMGRPMNFFDQCNVHRNVVTHGNCFDFLQAVQNHRFTSSLFFFVISSKTITGIPAFVWLTVWMKSENNEDKKTVSEVRHFLSHSYIFTHKIYTRNYHKWPDHSVLRTNN